MSGTRLAGRYIPEKCEIEIQPKSNGDAIRRTILHELAHHVMWHAGYRTRAHGWPFLAMELILSAKADCIDECPQAGILAKNALNWEPTAGLRLWHTHTYRAWEIFCDMEKEETWGQLSPEDAAHIIIESCGIAPHKRRLVFWRHSHYANTMGFPNFLRPIFLIFVVLAIASIVTGLGFLGRDISEEACVVALLGGLLTKLRAPEDI